MAAGESLPNRQTGQVSPPCSLRLIRAWRYGHSGRSTSSEATSRTKWERMVSLPILRGLVGFDSSTEVSDRSKSLVAGQRAGAGDFFEKFHILSVAWKFFHDCVELFGHQGRGFFAHHLLIVFVELGVFKDFADCLAKDLDPLLGNTWRGNEGGTGHHEGAIYLEQSSLFVRFGKGFDFWQMGEARMFSLFGNL